MKLATKLTCLLPIGLLIACESVSSEPEFPDAQMTQLANYRLAQNIADNCGRYDMEVSETDFNTLLDQELRSEGYTAQDFQDMLTTGVPVDWMNNYTNEYYASLNVDPSKGMSICTLGDRTSAARSDIAVYLKPVSPAS